MPKEIVNMNDMPYSEHEQYKKKASQWKNKVDIQCF